LPNQIQGVFHNPTVYKNIALVWVPGHGNFKGIKTADKAATNLQMPSDLKMNTCDLKSKIKKESLATWQHQWEQSINQSDVNYLHKLRWELGSYPSIQSKS
jgi:hypothetical protein